MVASIRDLQPKDANRAEQGIATGTGRELPHGRMECTVRLSNQQKDDLKHHDWSSLKLAMEQAEETGTDTDTALEIFENKELQTISRVAGIDLEDQQAIETR